MSYLKKIAGACAVAATLVAGNAVAAPITLSFEGVGDLHNVDTFYAGGTSSNGNSGTDHGIVFGSSFYGLVDSDAGGNGVLANLPSGNTGLFFLDNNDATITVAQGFENAFSFYYSANLAGFVNVFDGQSGTGTLLATVNLAYNNAACSDIRNQYCNYALVNMTFDGLARSVVFGGEPGYLVFDNLSFGADPVSGDVPEPATLGLTALGLAGLIAGRRKAAAKR